LWLCGVDCVGRLRMSMYRREMILRFTLSRHARAPARARTARARRRAHARSKSKHTHTGEREDQTFFSRAIIHDKPPSGWAPRYKAVLGVKSENAYIMI
jgi:hypothetical protein